MEVLFYVVLLSVQGQETLFVKKFNSFTECEAHMRQSFVELKKHYKENDKEFLGSGCRKKNDTKNKN